MFQCEMCGKEFPTKQKLGGHISGHKRLGKKITKSPKEKRFCKYCGVEILKRRNKFCSKECFQQYEKEHSNYKGMNITVAELEEYKKSHIVCEICGREETMSIKGKTCNLAVDHDHKTNKFRGLLCYSCNTKLSWYENWKNNIENYLKKVT